MAQGLISPVEEPALVREGARGAPACESFVPMPSSVAAPSRGVTTPLTPVVCDDRAIAALLWHLLHRGGLSASEMARRQNCTYNNIGQYVEGRRSPSLVWFVRFVELCGARVWLEYPPER